MPKGFLTPILYLAQPSHNFIHLSCIFVFVFLLFFTYSLRFVEPNQENSQAKVTLSQIDIKQSNLSDFRSFKFKMPEIEFFA